eukprot:3152298-Rhodomonas_salina.1
MGCAVPTTQDTLAFHGMSGTVAGCCGMCGTQARYAATTHDHGTVWCYGMFGTETGYAATRRERLVSARSSTLLARYPTSLRSPRPCPVLAERMLRSSYARPT